MKARVHDPLRLDVAAAAADGAALSGQWPVAAMPRLQGDAVGDGDLQVAWAARFGLRPQPGAEPQPELHLQAQARVARQCQRCLEPVLVALAVDRRFRFASTEDEAAALDTDSEDDVLAVSRRFDLRVLVEDELLLASPLVPRHEACPAPLAPAGAAPEVEAPAHPFAALAALKRGGGH